MKAFYIPVINGYYKDEAAVRIEDKSWQEVRALALKSYDEDYVDIMMDGHGYIEVKTADGKIRYIQES